MSSTMTWKKLLDGGRLMDQTGSDAGVARTDFHRDHDRIAFSHPFRRLNDKTQVHPLSRNDHVHSRLTHSMEVSIVGRSLGVAVADKLELPAEIDPAAISQILQAACLAHDIGNPPFGHAGEDAIQRWFGDPKNARHLEGLTPAETADFQSFEGNAQGFRLLTNVEHNPGAGGMRLTHATLGALMKYPWTSEHAGAKKKFGAFQAEKHLLERVAEATGLLQLENGRHARHPLAFLAEAADDICYRVIDLEDAAEIGLLSFEATKAALVAIGGEAPDASLSERNQLSYLRARAITKAVLATADAFAKNEARLLAGEITDDLISLCPAEIREPLDAANQLAWERVYGNHRKMELQLGGYRLLGDLLELFCSATRERIENEKASYHCEQVMALLKFDAPRHGDALYPSLLKVTDFISGMTDQYAARTARQLAGMGE